MLLLQFPSRRPADVAPDRLHQLSGAGRSSIPLAIRLIRPQNAIPTIIAIAMVIHLLGTLAGAAWLGELDYWQSAPCTGLQR